MTSSSKAGTQKKGAKKYGVVDVELDGTRVLFPDRSEWFTLMGRLLGDGWTMCVDLVGVDYLTYKGSRPLPEGVEAERFEVVANLVSHEQRDRLRVRVQVPEDDPTLASIYEVYPGTDFFEREIFDMFGIEFEGHPDMSRILMPETWQGHPLRKDYSTGGIPVQFKQPQSHDTDR